MIKLKLSIDPTQPKQVEALNVLLMIIGQPKAYPTTMNFSDPIVVKGEDIIKSLIGAEPEKPKRTRAGKQAPLADLTPGALADATDDGGMNETLLEDQKEAENANGPAESLVTIEQVREVLGKKVGDHRETIKAKLTGLGAKNVSVLDASHYDAFHAFLTNL